MMSVSSAGGRTEEDSLVYGFSAAALSRFFLVLGRTALQHLLCIEQTSKAIRASRLAADRAAAEALERQLAAAAAAGGSGGSRKGKAAATAPQPANEDIGAQLGVGSVAADAELDALADKIESQAGVYMPFKLSYVCSTAAHHRQESDPFYAQDVSLVHWV